MKSASSRPPTLRRVRPLAIAAVAAAALVLPLVGTAAHAAPLASSAAPGVRMHVADVEHDEAVSVLVFTKAAG